MKLPVVIENEIGKRTTCVNPNAYGRLGFVLGTLFSVPLIDHPHCVSDSSKVQRTKH